MRKEIEKKRETCEEHDQHLFSQHLEVLGIWKVFKWIEKFTKHIKEENI